MKSFRLKILTARGPAFDGDVESMVVHSVDGEMGILAHFMPMLTALPIGILRFVQQGRTHWWVHGDAAVGSKGAEGVDVLTEYAMEADSESAAAERLARLKDWYAAARALADTP